MARPKTIEQKLVHDLKLIQEAREYSISADGDVSNITFFSKSKRWRKRLKI